MKPLSGALVCGVSHATTKQNVEILKPIARQISCSSIRFGGKLVLACVEGAQTETILLSSNPNKKGSIGSLGGSWSLLAKALSFESLPLKVFLQ